MGSKDVQEALGVSATVAWRLLKSCGAALGPGKKLACRREELIDWLEDLLSGGGRVDWEVRRRTRVAEILERARVVAPAEVRQTRLGALPPNVSLTPRKLTVEFENAGELLEALGAIVFAVSNDLEAVRELIGSYQIAGR